VTTQLPSTTAAASSYATPTPFSEELTKAKSRDTHEDVLQKVNHQLDVKEEELDEPYRKQNKKKIERIQSR
jgi:CBS-domain-containing membrane protein